MRARLAGVYFLHYGYVGATLGYLAPYLRGLGFSGEAIGGVTMTAQLVAAPSALLWAHAADLRRSRATLLRTCALGAFLSMCGLPFARTPLGVGAVLVGQAVFGSAVVPLLDSLTMEWARAEAGRSYARTRLFGSMGFVVVAQGLGLWLAARGDRPADPIVPLAAMACIGGYVLLLHAAAPAQEAEPSATAPLHFREALALLGDGGILSLFALCFVHWAACAPYHLFFGVLVRDLALPSSVTGAGLAIGVLAEVAAFWSFPPLLRRFELRALFVVACSATALRWWLVSRASGGAAIVLLQLFHGLTFGLWWACAVEAMARLVPPGQRATGQALFSALVFGAGNAVGYGLAGIGYHRLGGASPLFALAAVAELCALPLCAVAGRRLAGAGTPRVSARGGAPPGNA